MSYYPKAWQIAIPSSKSIMGRLVVAGVLSAAFAAQSLAAQPLVQPEVLKISVKGAGLFGGDVEMVTHLYKPQGSGPFPVVIFLHGRSSDRNIKSPIVTGHGNYWMRRGFALVASIRPGYGDTGGLDREDSGVRGSGGSCKGTPDYARIARNAGAAVYATMDWLRDQPWSHMEKILLVGQSVGGLTAIGTAANNPPGVMGVINFAGGAGGHAELTPGRSCQPEKLTELYEAFGKTIKVPSLWLYAENDLYWGPDVPRDWHKAFAAGGSETKFVMTEPVGDDGHQLLVAGGKLWGPHVDQFVKELRF